MMNYLARRNHSEKELREKLESQYTPEDIENAIAYGKSKGWIPDSEQDLIALAEKTAADLRRRGKGSEYINQYLEQKGLPAIKSDSMDELEKARQLVKNKFTPLESPTDREQEKYKAKMGRFLVSRGFDTEIVRKVIYED